MNREQLLRLRERLIMGNPPYVKDPVLGIKKRDGGTPGIEELKSIGDYTPAASGVVLALESTLQLVEHLLERIK